MAALKRFLAPLTFCFVLPMATAASPVAPQPPAPARPSYYCAPHERAQLTYKPNGERQFLVPSEYSYWLREAAQANGVPEELLFALVWHESGFCQNAISRTGAIGLGQLMPGTAQMMGVDPYNPQQNLHGAARYLGQQLRRFGSVELALAAYNAGPGRVGNCNCVPPFTETINYVNNISAMFSAWRP